jgi:Zn-dependent protease/CBS domain-containing protein
MGGVRLGRVAGIEVRVDWSWFPVYGFLAWTLAGGIFGRMFHFAPGPSWALGLLAALLLFGSVLFHELSHAVVARRLGMEVAGITLFLFGGVAQINGEPPTPRAEFCVAVAGPLASLFLGFACLGAAWALPPVAGARPPAALLTYLGVVNLCLALFNLIPAFPLDGGRILRSALWQLTGSLRHATQWASRSGRVFGLGLVGYGLVWEVALHGEVSGLWLALVGWYLHGAAVAAYQQVWLRGALSGVPVLEAMTDEVPVVDGDLRIPQFVEEFLLRHGQAAYPLVRDGELLGVVTLEDVQRLERNLWGVTCVGVLARMPEEQRVVEDDQDAWTALTQMLEAGTSRLLVVHHGRLRGIISREGLLKLVQRRSRLGLPAGPERIPLPPRAAAR